MLTAQFDRQTKGILPHYKATENTQPAKDKKIYLELIRAFSMLLVIFNHTGTKGFFLFSIANDSVFFPFYCFISVACTMAVPLYWMISGALLLPKDESIKQVYLHRVLRMILVLVIFSFAYFIRELVKEPRQIGPGLISYFFVKLYTDRFATAFWFIYAYIGILLVLPFFRKLVKVMPRNYFYYLFLLVLFFRGALPILEYLASTFPAKIGLPFNTDLKIHSLNRYVTNNVFSQAVLCLFGGYYFDHLLTEQEITKKGVLKWLAAGFIAIVITCCMTQYKMILTGIVKEGKAQTFYKNLICLPTFAVFYFVRFLFQEHHFSDKVKKIILCFGQCAFGIMLCEKALREELMFIYEALVSAMHHSLPACIIWVLIIYLSSFAVTLCLKRIPGIRLLI